MQVVPDGDAEPVHAWVSQDRARFWVMGVPTRPQVLEIYGFLDGLDTHHAFLID